MIFIVRVFLDDYKYFIKYEVIVMVKWLVEYYFMIKDGSSYEWVRDFICLNIYR